MAECKTLKLLLEEGPVISLLFLMLLEEGPVISLLFLKTKNFLYLCLNN